MTDSFGAAEPGPPSEHPQSKPELVVIARPSAGPPSAFDTKARLEAELSDLQQVLEASGARIRPLFPGGDNAPSFGPAGKFALEENSGAIDLNRFYFVDAEENSLPTIAAQLAEQPTVEAVYIKPPAEAPALRPDIGLRLNAMPPAVAAPAPGTPDFTARQGYLNPAPVGIDAFHAWGIPGGRGTGIKVIDCEWGWNFSHEDLLLQQVGVVVGVPHPNDDHGTAVIGEIIGNRNSYGVVGIAAEAILGAASFHNKPSAQTIREAADKLSAGDVLLLEIHRPGPRSNNQGQFGYIAVEWWPDDFAAIRYAVNKGLVVVEAAGNGSQDFDDPVYEQRPPGFPVSWRNPFNPGNPTSGAIVVGAGNPPAGTHGRVAHPGWKEAYVDRARCGFSNFGRRVDCQGWGWEVTSTGYGDLQGGADRNRWYTDQFSGTSSASPIVTGAVAALQGILKASGRPLLTSPQAIALLRATGSPQQNAPGRPASQRIGKRPDLRQLIPAVLRPMV